MKKLFLLLSVLVLCMGIQAQIVTSESFIRKESSEAAKSRFSGYVEQMNIFNLNDGPLYSAGGNFSLGSEWNDILYVGGGISLYYVTDYYISDHYNSYTHSYSYYGTNHFIFCTDCFADIKCKILKNTIVTPVFGLKLGVGLGIDMDSLLMNIVTRPSAGILFRGRKNGGRRELMLNVEYVPAGIYELHGVSLNLGYKF